MSSAREPPGSYGIPLVGATNKVWNDFVGYVRDAMSNSSNEHPRAPNYAYKCPVFKTAVLGCSVAIVTGDKERRAVFSDTDKSFTRKGGYHTLLSGSMGESLLTDDTPKYVATVRTLFNEALSAEAVETHMPLIYSQIAQHMKHWADSYETGVNLYGVLKNMYGHLMLRILLGARESHAKSILRDCNAVFTGATSFPVSGGGLFTTAYEKGQKAQKRLRKLFKERLLKSMAEIRSDRKTCADKNAVEKKYSGAPLVHSIARRVLDMCDKCDPCKQSGGPHESLLEAAAAHLTLFSTGLTSKLLASLSVSFLRVLSRPNQANLKASLRKEAKDLKAARIHGTPVVPYAVLKDLKRLEKVCLEIERVFPPCAGLSRGTEQKAGKLCGYTIPKGWLIWSCNYTANRDPTLYKDPEVFDPERWNSKLKMSDGTNGACNVNNHIAFGTGNRKCIGTHLALAMWKAFCLWSASNYTWSIAKQSEKDSNSGTLDGTDGWRVKWIPVYSPTPDIKAHFKPE